MDSGYKTNMHLTNFIRERVGLDPITDEDKAAITTEDYYAAKTQLLVNLLNEHKDFTYNNLIEAKESFTKLENWVKNEIPELKQKNLVEFTRNDVYEVNKRIERLEIRISQVESLLKGNIISAIKTLLEIRGGA